jgi:hypothetical protein
MLRAAGSFYLITQNLLIERYLISEHGALLVIRRILNNGRS